MVQPLFISSMDVLKARLRLSGARQTDALAILDSVVQQVRVNLYDQLPASRITTILASAEVDNPTTAAEAMRVKASLAEFNWIRYYLLRRLPTLWMDDSGGAQQTWNEEGFARTSQRELDKELNRLHTEIYDALRDLTGDNAVDAGTGYAAVIGPDVTPPRPYASIVEYQGGIL